MQATRNAWDFIWKNKVLVVFGVFAAFLGQFGIVDFLSRVGIITGETDQYFNSVANAGMQMGNFATRIAVSLESKMLTYFLLMIFFGLISVFVFIATVSQGAIIYSIRQSIKKKPIDITKAWHIGSANFWRLFFVHFFKQIALTLICMIISLSAYAAFSLPSLVNNLFFLGMFLFFSFAGMVLALVAIYTTIYIIVEKFSINEAFTAAWELFKNHWIVSFEVGILLLVFNLFVGIFAMLGFVLLILPAILIWFIFILVGGNGLVLTAGLIASIMIFTMYLMLVGAMFTIFTTYIWTYVFMKMDKTGVKSRIVHYLSYKPNKI